MRAWLSSLKEPVALGFSGGVDSAFLLVAASRWGRFQLFPFFMDSCLVSSLDRKRAKRVLEEVGARHFHCHFISWDPLDIREIRQNSSRRCYFCKKTMYSLLRRNALEKGAMIVMDGTQADDIGRDRPGIAALDELEITRPLADFGIGKILIRNTLKKWGFSFWDLASESCLATRIFRDTEISMEKLLVIDKLQDFLNKISVNANICLLNDNNIHILFSKSEDDHIKMCFEEMKRIGQEFKFFFK